LRSSPILSNPKSRPSLRAGKLDPLMRIALPILFCIGAALVGGVFFAFSTFVMKALEQLPASQGIKAMQRINVVALNPLFLSVFVGTALFASVCIVAGFVAPGATRSQLLLAAGIFHLVGCFGVTVAFNVPRNERLARLESESAQAEAYWPVYVREWLLWNHVRTIASLVAAACAAMALTY